MKVNIDVKMPSMPPVLTHVFKAIEKSDIESLSLCQERDIRPILPCLVRMSLIAPLDHSEECIHGRKVILRILSGIEAVNALVALLSIDFTALEADVKREQSLRQKLGGAHQSESILIQNLINGLALEFECSDPTRRLRLLLSELLLVMAQMKEARSTYYLKSSELFDNLCYLEEVSDVLCIALAELPSLLPPAEVAEALLHLYNGPIIICKIVANQPDSFREVVAGLIQSGEKQDEDSQGGLIRLKAVRLLCQMNPSQALNVRAMCVDLCVMPALAIYITLDITKLCSSSTSETSAMEGYQATYGIPTNMGRDDNDVLSFLTGLLLSNDQQQRSWFSQFIKSAQRRKFDQPSSALVALRAELVDRLRSLLLFTTSDTLPESQVIKAAALLRLYCALRSLAGLKFNEEKEVGLLLQLVTCRPPPSASGIRFVSTGLCMLIACPSLIAAPENEKRASEWIKWLVKEEAYFSVASGVSSSSFGAMLLLMAIHFHLQDLSAIVDLVSAALGMKVATSGNNKMQRIKYIFTHDVFTEQVVTAHAVKVPVTADLNANMPGFLPIHCIYHQLKSRMFTKHRVPIKQWIYRQICNVQIPLHPFMPQLIEVFVSSILLPSAKGGQTDAFNEPFTEQEIMDVFSLLTFKTDKKTKDGNRFSHSSFKLRSRSSKWIAKSKLNVSNALKKKEALNGQDMETDLYVASVMPSQLLLLYYLLLYEDVRLSNMQQFLVAGRRVHTYSSHLFAELPIRYLLSHAQRDQKLYAGLFSSLLKLLVTHYPQLCVLEDWLYRPPSNQMAILPPQLHLNAASLESAMQSVVCNPAYLLVLLNKMLELPLHQLWVLADPLVTNIKHLLVEGVPRKILDTYRLVWLHLNSLFPRRLWAMTVEGLRSDDSQWRLKLTEDDIVLDPLYVLRCDVKVFRCEPILQILIYLLQVYLLSSKTYLSQHIKNQPATGFPVSLDEEREKLRGALVLTQESAAVQILLESVLDDPKKTKLMGQNFVLQETRSIVCSFLHQAFIMDTTLAKLVHFQGYSKDLIGPLVQGVPSMHIAVGLGWIPELLQLPDLQKQLFAVELTSHLALQNSMPSTLSIARLVLNTLTTLLSVLGEEERLEIVEKSPNALIRIACAFPELLDDILHLMVSFGRVALAQAALMEAPSPKTIGFYNTDEQTVTLLDKSETKETKPILSIINKKEEDETSTSFSTREDELCLKVKAAFKELVVQATMSSEIY